MVKILSQTSPPLKTSKGFQQILWQWIEPYFFIGSIATKNS